VPPESSVRQAEHTGTDGRRVAKVRGDGTVWVRKIKFRLGGGWAGKLVYVVSAEEKVMFVDHDGVVIAEHPWPLPGIAYVGSKQLHRPKASGMS